MINPIQYKALCLLREFPLISSRFFAMEMWGAERPYIGRKKPWLLGGSYMGKLEAMGFIRRPMRFSRNYEGVQLTTKAKDALLEYEQGNKQIDLF